MLKNLYALCRMAAVVLVVLDATASQAHAYIDPGAGSYALQIALAGLAGALVSFKLIFAKIRALFSKKSAQDVKQGTTGLND